MPTLVTSATTHKREDLNHVITILAREETPFKTEIGTAKATNTYHEFLTDTLAAPNKDNAFLEGQDAVGSTLSAVSRLGNYTQIFRKEVKVSDTLEAMNYAGTSNEYARQIEKAGREINRDIETALVSANVSQAESGSNPRKLAGAEAWIKTNALHGTGGATAGFAGSTVGAVTAGTARALTKAMIDELAIRVWNEGGDPTLIIAPGRLKQKISTFATGNGAWNQDAAKATMYTGVDVYVSDFGRHSIIPHRYMSTTTVIAFDPTLWNLAVARKMTKVDIAKGGDNSTKMLRTELTLECLNEAGNGKISDLNG